MLRIFVFAFLAFQLPQTKADDFTHFPDVQDFLTNYCIDCHSGPDAEANVDLESLLHSSAAVGNPLESNFGLWKTMNQLIVDGVMPPADSSLPKQKEKDDFQHWFSAQLAKVNAKPSPIGLRRLANHEYRNTLRSVFGFDLQVNIQEAEQTISEKSLVMKLLPTDPPGKSGFTNDTHANPLSNHLWDQYMYLSDAVTRELFQPQNKHALLSLADEHVTAASLTPENATRLMSNFLVRARRRDVSRAELDQLKQKFEGLHDTELVAAVRLAMQAELLSPRFLFRGSSHPDARTDSSQSDGQLEMPVDEFELAERISYFLWADMPDDQLMSHARSGTLRENLNSQVIRMLASPKAYSLANDFGVQWLGLDEINLQVSNNPPQLDALQKQPREFLNYLFTQRRPILELITSRVSFINPHTAKYYGGRIYKQLPKYRKQKGIEIEIVANTRVELEPQFQRGGILTMPGVLAMNRSPILRGTWLLEKILGQELPEPPPNVPAIAPANGSQELTFRQRFEKHRAQETCAVCHDKIDPLGFAFENFDEKGKLRKLVTSGDKSPQAKMLDTSGQLPSGETFEDAENLKQLLVTTKRDAIIKNIVEKTLSYALCRELSVYDVPTVDRITKSMLEPEATWEDLFLEIARSLPFQKHCPPAT